MPAAVTAPFLRWITTLLSLLLISLSAQAFDLSELDKDDPFLPVDEAFRLVQLQQADGTIQLLWQIEPGYYLYRDKIELQAEGVSYQLPVYPQATIHEDPYFGEVAVYYFKLELTLPVTEIAPNNSLSVKYQGCAEAGLCYPPVTKRFSLTPVQQATPATPVEQPQGRVFETDDLGSLLANTHLAVALAIFFALGLGLAFTPCVFPLYPILSGILVGQGQQLTAKRGLLLAFFYVQGMALTYAALGLLVASFGGQFQAALQHPAVLIAVAILFVLLALSMFGAYTLQLPSSWQSRIQQTNNRLPGGKIGGVFAMGVLSGLVASPCTTAPLTGALVYVAQSGDQLVGGIALYLLALGMGVPLLLLGASGGKLLPKAGAWMDQIKRLFGYVLLAVAVMFLSRLLPELLSMSLLTLLALGVLFDLLRPANRLSKAFTLPLVAIIAIATGFGWQQTLSYQRLAQLQQGKFIRVDSLESIDTARASAAAQGLPVMLDFYADWCVACKDFEHKTFPEPAVAQQLEQFVLLQIDLTEINAQGSAVMAHYQVLGLPTILFFDRAGNPLPAATITGFKGPDAFAKHLTTLLAR